MDNDLMARWLRPPSEPAQATASILVFVQLMTSLLR